MFFHFPEIFVIPLAILLYLVFFKKKNNLLCAITPNQTFLKQIRPSLRQRARQIIIPILWWATLLFFTIAASGPYKREFIEPEAKKRNLLLVLDISKSMSTRDFTIGADEVNRLTALQYVVHQFIERRINDRIGMVVFGTFAYLQSPLTTDRPLLQSLLNTLIAGTGGPGTAIGDGIGLAVKRLTSIAKGTKAIILATDGVNNSGNTSPVQASEIAAKLGIKIYTIGIGRAGEDFNEEVLQKIANITAGRYFYAGDTALLEDVYSQIDLLETTTEKDPKTTYNIELYPIFAFIGGLIFFLFEIGNRWLFMIIP
jgi:Ca-activated chloride channel homolog